MQHHTQLSPQCLFVYSDQTHCYVVTVSVIFTLIVEHYLLFHLSFALVSLSFIIVIMIMRKWSVMTVRELSVALFPDLDRSYVQEVNKRTKCALCN